MACGSHEAPCQLRPPWPHAHLPHQGGEVPPGGQQPGSIFTLILEIKRFTCITSFTHFTGFAVFKFFHELLVLLEVMFTYFTGFPILLVLPRVVLVSVGFS